MCHITTVHCTVWYTTLYTRAHFTTGTHRRSTATFSGWPAHSPATSTMWYKHRYFFLKPFLPCGSNTGTSFWSHLYHVVQTQVLLSEAIIPCGSNTSTSFWSHFYHVVQTPVPVLLVVSEVTPVKQVLLVVSEVNFVTQVHTGHNLDYDMPVLSRWRKIRLTFYFPSVCVERAERVLLRPGPQVPRATRGVPLQCRHSEDTCQGIYRGTVSRDWVDTQKTLA